MKTKIMNALRTEYANLGLGDKAFDGVASFLVQTITEEGQIADAIKKEGVKALLKSIQGESDSLRTRASQLQKDLDDYKKTHPESTTPPPEDQTDTNHQALLDKLAAIEARLAAQDKETKAKETLAAVLAAAKANGCTDEKGYRLTERLFSMKDGEKVEDAAARFKSEYDATMKEYFGNGAVPPGGKGVPDSAEAYKKMLSDYADSKGLGEKKNEN